MCQVLHPCRRQSALHYSREPVFCRMWHRRWYGDRLAFTSFDLTKIVPVIVIFTKFDALDTQAFTDLKKQGRSRKEARELAADHAISSFEGQHLEALYKRTYPPRAHIYLRGRPELSYIKIQAKNNPDVPDMNKEGSKCGDLVEKTAASLSNETLQQLFVSTQRNNTELCMRYALERCAYIF